MAEQTEPTNKKKCHLDREITFLEVATFKDSVIFENSDFLNPLRNHVTNIMRKQQKNTQEITHEIAEKHKSIFGDIHSLAEILKTFSSRLDDGLAEERKDILNLKKDVVKNSNLIELLSKKISNVVALRMTLVATKQKNLEIIEEINESYTQKIEGINVNHTQKIEGINVNHTQKIEQINVNHTQKIKKINKNCTQQIEEINKNCTQKIKQMSLKHSKVLSRLNSKHSQELVDIEKINDSNSQEIVELKRSFTDFKEAVKKNFEKLSNLTRS